VSQLLLHPFVAKMDEEFDFSVWIKAAMDKRAVFLAERKAMQSSSEESSDFDSYTENGSSEIGIEDQEDINSETES
jgi:hypothetical protein